MMPPVIAGIMLLLIVVLYFFFPLMTVLEYPLNLFGFVPIIVGLLFNLRANNLMQLARTTVKPDGRPTKLITDGVFKYSRNPMYLGIALILAGIAMLLSELSAFLPVFIFMLIIQVKFIPMEEEKMKKLFGKEYMDYKKKVSRWV